MNINHGILVPTAQHGETRAFVSNVKAEAYDDEDFTGATETIDEACIILCRRTFSGLGLTHIVPLRDFWRLMDDTKIDQIFNDATKELFGAVSPRDQQVVGDLIFNSMDTLFTHPPEESLEEERKREERKLERSGLLLIVNDQVVVDAR
jgi:hypothetical protein